MLQIVYKETGKVCIPKKGDRFSINIHDGVSTLSFSRPGIIKGIVFKKNSQGDLDDKILLPELKNRMNASLIANCIATFLCLDVKLIEDGGTWYTFELV